MSKLLIVHGQGDVMVSNIIHSAFAILRVAEICSIVILQLQNESRGGVVDVIQVESTVVNGSHQFSKLFEWIKSKRIRKKSGIRNLKWRVNRYSAVMES